MKGGRKRLAIIAIMLIAAGGSAYAAHLWREAQPLPFDRIEWTSAEEYPRGYEGVQRRMAEHLLASGQLIGKSRVEIIGMFGYPAGMEEYETGRMVYSLGPDHGWRRKSRFPSLVIQLDSSRKVSDARIETKEN